MAQENSGLQKANDQLNRKREEAKEQGLAEQNVTGATPPAVDSDKAAAERPTPGNGSPP